jgi:hypothetical protein
MRSRRGALRFPCEGPPISYKTAYEAGEARLRNISSTGCAFLQASLPLSVGERVLVTVPLSGEEQVFQAQGIVVRLEEGGCIAIRFSLVEPEDQALVRNYFARQMRKG